MIVNINSIELLKEFAKVVAETGEPRKVYSNLILAGLKIDEPMQCIASDMTFGSLFRLKGTYYELTLYMDLWNNEILSYALSAKRGNRMIYISGLHDLIEQKKQYPEYKMGKHEKNIKTHDINSRFHSIYYIFSPNYIF